MYWVTILLQIEGTQISFLRIFAWDIELEKKAVE